MSDNKHTPGKWVVSGVTGRGDIGIENEWGDSIASVHQDGLFDEHDARRIIACVNACAGIPTEVLESDYAQGYEPWGYVEHLKKSVAACERQVNELAEINQNLEAQLAGALAIIEREGNRNDQLNKMAEIKADLLDVVREFVDDLGYAEWATPEHAEQLLNELIKKYFRSGRAAIARAEK